MSRSCNPPSQATYMACGGTTLVYFSSSDLARKLVVLNHLETVISLSCCPRFLATGPKVCGFKHGRGPLRSIFIRRLIIIACSIQPLDPIVNHILTLFCRINFNIIISSVLRFSRDLYPSWLNVYLFAFPK